MITKHRITRSRTKAQAGSIGAPLRGVFRVEITSLDAGTGVAVVEARASSNVGDDEPIAAWTPSKTIDPAAFRCWEGGIAGTIQSAAVNATGEEIEILYTVDGLSPVFEVIAGHPALVGANGTQCGGAYRN